MRKVSRRGFVAAAGAAAAMPAAGFAQSASPSPLAAGWSFTDDRAYVISLPETPARVAAMAYAAQSLYDFGYTVDAYYGPSPSNDADNEFSVVGDLDLSALPYLGDPSGYDLEAFIARDIDLVVDFSYRLPDEEDYELWWITPDQEPDIAALAPTLGIAMWQVSADVSIARVAELAAALGAPVDAANIAEEKAAFDASVDALKAATAAKPDITVAAIRQSDTGFLLPATSVFGNFILFRDCGVTFIGEDDAHMIPGGSWYEYSAEEVGLLSADVILTFAPVAANPLYDSLPAVVAGQTGSWDSVKRMSYRGAQPSVQALADLIANAEKVV